MKKILTVYTGGTICSAPDGEKRDLSPALAKRALQVRFSQSNSPYAPLCAELFDDSGLCEEKQTLSENMTVAKLNVLLDHIRNFSLKDYAGVIVLHGTDTLAFSAALFAMVFANTPVPIMLVSGNRPPMDDAGNGAENFQRAAELILDGIAPNVYVPYRNQDGRMWLHLGSNLMQSANFSEDFYGASAQKSWCMDGHQESLVQQVNGFLQKEKKETTFSLENCKSLSEKVLQVYPHTGLDYARLSLEGIEGVVHGTYHSGTVCVERNKPDLPYTSHSLLWFAKALKERKIPLFVAPSRLDCDQYSSIHDLVQNGGVTLLNMTPEAAWAKLTLGLSLGLAGDGLNKFMRQELNLEMMN